MPLPEMTEEQRKKALEKAKKVRAKRTEFRAKCRAGKITPAKAIAKRTDPIVGRIKVTQFITDFPGYGPVAAGKIMGQIGIAESRRLSGLSERQAAELIEALS